MSRGYYRRYRGSFVPFDPPKEYVTDPSVYERIKKLHLNPYLCKEHKEFVESIKLFWESGYNYITTKQLFYFTNIEKNYSQEFIEKQNEFLKEWNNDPKLAINFKRCCEHYSKLNYYSSIVSKTYSNSEYIPTHEEYKKLCTNKYSLKLLKAFDDSPKYKVGQLVSVLKKSRYQVDYTELAIILVVDVSPPTDAINGAKKYKVQCLKTNRQFVCLERDIKKIKRKKEDV